MPSYSVLVGSRCIFAEGVGVGGDSFSVPIISLLRPIHDLVIPLCTSFVSKEGGTSFQPCPDVCVEK